MERTRRIVMAAVLALASYPVLSVIAAPCSAQLSSAPRACCGTTCTCGDAGGCGCRMREKPQVPVSDSSPAPMTLAALTEKLVSAGSTIALHPATFQRPDGNTGSRLLLDFVTDPPLHPERRLDRLGILRI